MRTKECKRGRRPFAVSGNFLFTESHTIKVTTYVVPPDLFGLDPLQKMMEHLRMRTANPSHDAKKPSIFILKYEYAGLFWPA